MLMNQATGIYKFASGLFAVYPASKPKIAAAAKGAVKTFATVAVLLFVFGFTLGMNASLAEAQALSTASSVTCNSAVLQGDVYIGTPGTPTRVWFEWGPTVFMGNVTPEQILTSSGSFSSPLSNLNQSTTYYYRSVASNQPYGTVYGSIKSFTTLSCAPTGQQPIVYTNLPTAVSQTSATLNGSVDPRGIANTEAWFEWGTTSSFGNTTSSSVFGNGPTSFSFTLAGLNSNTTYYYRAVAKNQFGTVYGEPYQFSTGYGGAGFYYSDYTSGTGWGNMVFSGTAPSYSYTDCNLYPNFCYQGSGGAYYTSGYGNQPVVYTYSPTSSDSGYVILNGYVDPRGNTNILRWFEWGTSRYSLNQRTVKTNQSYAGNFSDGIGTLSQGTVYYYRAAAQSLQYDSGVAYGQVLSFTAGSSGRVSGYSGAVYATSAAVQTSVITNLASDTTATSARLNGQVRIPGTLPLTNAWFEWGTTSSLGNSTAARNAGNSENNYISETLSGLTPDATYYYRASAQNQYGIFRGDIVTFKTGSTAVAAKPSPVVSVAAKAAPRVSLVTLKITADKETVLKGDHLSFVVDYTNVDTNALKDVFVRVLLPEEYEYVDSSRGVYSKIDNSVTLEAGTVLPKEGGRIIVKADMAKTPEADKALVTSAMAVYTTTGGVQEMATAYAIQKLNPASPALALALFGDGFLPTTLLGWLILVIVIFTLILLSRKLYGAYKENKKTETKPEEKSKK